MFKFLKNKLFKNKDNKIRFYPLYSGAEKFTPIVPAASYKREWLELAKKKFVEKVKTPETVVDNKYPLMSTHRCPGLTSLFSRGYIVTAHKDIQIWTEGDIENPVLHSNKLSTTCDSWWFQTLGIKEEINPFSSDELVGMKRPYPRKTPNMIIKILSPWLMKLPDDVVMLATEVPFGNTQQDFTVVTGIVDANYTNVVQTLLWWHHHDTCRFIKKGTPLMQLIPIPRKNIYTEFELVTNEKEIRAQIYRHNLMSHIRNSRYIRNYSEIRDTIQHFDKTQKSKCPFAFLHKS